MASRADRRLFAGGSVAGFSDTGSVVPEREVDPASLYERERVAFLRLFRGLTPEQLAATVPATPAWSVGDVLAHLVGITADLNAQRFGDGRGDEWTAAQIGARRGHSIEELAAEWDHEAAQFETGLQLFGYGLAAHYLGDLLQHVSDVRSALGESPVRNDEALAVALDFYLESFEDTLDAAEIGAVGVRCGHERWRLGPGELIASVAAPRFELFRALGGRRTLNEIRELAWTGDSEAVVGYVSRYPAPARTLGEPRRQA
jgi:uncharacterized protein (TIGR03083 family)